MKRLISLILIGIISFTSFYLVYGEDKEFNDITNHWGKALILKLVAMEAIDGYPDGDFKPDNSIKVGEFTKILVGSLGHGELGNSSEVHWSLNYINKAKELRLIENSEFDTEDFDRNINRGEMARMIARAITEEYPAALTGYKALIKDYDLIPIEYQDSVLKAFAKGIITGYEDGTFQYERNATRAEASTMIVRLLDQSERKYPEIEIVSNKIVIDDQEIIPEVKEVAEKYNEIINYLESNIDAYNSRLSTSKRLVILPYDSEYVLQKKYYIEMRLTNDKDYNYILSLKSFDDVTLKEFKEILKIFFPTRYEDVLNYMLELKKTENYHAYNNEFTYDGRTWGANYNELNGSVAIFIKAIK